MKLLHVINGSHFGGASVLTAELAAAQRKLGADARVCLLEGGATAERIRLLDVPVFTHDPKGSFTNKRVRWDALYQGFRDICAGFAPEILHSHLALPNIMCARWKRERGTTWIATLHGSWRQYMYSPETSGAAWRRPYLMLRYGFGVAWTTRRADALVTMSKESAKDWTNVGIDTNRLHVILNGIPELPKADSELRSEWKLPQDAYVLGSLGYFAPVKGFDILIRAFDHIAERFANAYLVIAGGDVLGNPAVRAALNKLRNESKAAERILLLSEQTSSAQFLAALDAFVLASRSEGMSLALLEAMQHGLPCVVSSVGGNPEAVRDNVDGLVFRSGDASDLAKKFERLLADPLAATQMGLAGRDRSRAALTIERCAEDYLKLCEEIHSSS